MIIFAKDILKIKTSTETTFYEASKERNEISQRETLRHEFKYIKLTLPQNHSIHILSNTDRQKEIGKY